MSSPVEKLKESFIKVGKGVGKKARFYCTPCEREMSGNFYMFKRHVERVHKEWCDDLGFVSESVGSPAPSPASLCNQLHPHGHLPFRRKFCRIVNKNVSALCQNLLVVLLMSPLKGNVSMFDSE